MIFIESKLKGAYLINIEKNKDDRGWFARSFCKKEFEGHTLEFDIVQCSISHNKQKGTLRGMHYQNPPYEEHKIISCIKGSIYDVIIDLRKESETYLKWESFNLTEENKSMLYVPKGFAHGFLTLQDDTDVYYQMSEYYHPECVNGLRWNDKVINITWPNFNHPVISKADENWRQIDDCY